MQYRFFRFLYTDLKDIVHLYHDRNYRLRHKWEMILLFILIVRLSFVPLTRLKFQKWCSVWNYDPISVFMINEYDQLYYYLFVICLMLFILGIIATNIFHFTTPVDTCTMLYPYDLIVRNFDQFQQCILDDDQKKRIWQTRFDHNMKWFIGRGHLPRMITEFACRIWTDCQYRLYFDHIDKQLMNGKFRLVYFPYIEFRARRYLIILQILLNSSFFVLHVIAFPIMCLLFAQYYRGLAEQFHMNRWYNKIWFAIEVITLTDAVYTSVECGLLGAGMELIIGAFHYFLINKWNPSLKSIRIQMNAINTSQRRRCQMNRELSKIHRDHGRLSKIYRKAFSEAWGSILLVYLMISIPMNVSIILLLRSGILETFEYMSGFVGIVVHTIITMVLIVPMCFEVETLHQTKKDLPAIVPNIRHIRLKLKYDDWYGRLIHGPKYGPVIATLGSITYKMALEVKYIY